VLNKPEAMLLTSNGVFAADCQTIAKSFELQGRMNPALVKKVGHIPLAFAVDDKERLTDDFMTKLALEYMQRMGIVNTQYIVVRHHNTPHPHCHIVFNRVNNYGKTISDKSDYHRNVKVTKELKEKYSLTFGVGKDRVNIPRLRKTNDKRIHVLYHYIKTALRQSSDWQQFTHELAKTGVGAQFKYKGQTSEIQGIIFTKDNKSYKGSSIDRSFSYAKLNAVLNQSNLTIQPTGGTAGNDKTGTEHSESSNMPIGLSALAGGIVSGTASSEEESIETNKKKKRKQLKM